MNIAETLAGFGTTAVGYIVPFLFVLTIVVFFHELGHFLVARWCGIKVSVFSVGFGPEIAGFNDRTGTRWRLSAIPLGGYVRFFGDENEASVADRAAVEAMTPEERKHSFAGKGVAARAAVVAAGPIANFVLAVVIFAAIFSTVGQDIVTPEVDSIVAGSAAEQAGFQVGDVVESINGTPIKSFNDLQRIVSFAAGEDLTVVVDRDGQELTLHATPRLQEKEDPLGNKQRVGILGIGRNATGDQVVRERYALPQATLLGLQETWFITDRTISYLVGVVAGRESADQLGGPIRVAEVSAEVATFGIVALINLAAVLSVSIGLINLFPIPMLDGGHLLYFAIEAVRGKPLSERIQEIGFRIGLAAVLMLMMFATWNDIVHLTTS